MNIINNPTFGADFELFLFDNKNNEVINAKKYVKGTKENPYNFDESNPFWCTSLDNISMEGNIPPCTNAIDFSNSIEKVINYMNSNLPKNLCTVHSPAVFVNPKYLKSKEARHFGCIATLNAYTGYENPMPDGQSTNLRTCCTHIHLSYDNMNNQTSFEFIKACDLFLGIPSLLIEPSNQRKTLYGKLGECRISKKTVEYRVLSSYFSKNDTLRRWVFENAQKAIDFVNQGHRVGDYLTDVMHKAFYDENLELASNIVQDYKINLPTT